MEDNQIIDLYWARDQRAIDETSGKYGGFLLQYGDVEINAAFSALAEEKREALEDLINRELFADGEDED